MEAGIVMRKGFNKTQRERGVTLTELLVVLAIIGLLATIAVPTYLSKMELARVNTARQEVKTIAEAETACAIRHGFYVPLQMLDDIVIPVEDRAGFPGGERFDDLFNTRREINPLYLIDPFADLEFQEQSATNQYTLQDSDGTNAVKRVRDLFLYWDGPFIQYKRVWTGSLYKPDNPQVLDDSERALDWPLDPWGNPYLFYSPLGIIGSQAALDDPDVPYSPDDLDNESFGDGRLTQEGEYEFDRFAIVSYGPNGVVSDGDSADAIENDEADNDDIIYMFGRIPNESAFRAF